MCEAIQARGIKNGSESSSAIPIPCMQYLPGPGHRNRFALRLWAIHKPWDIAVFRVTDRPVNHSKNCVVKKEEICWATLEECRKPENTPYAWFWSVGYNLAMNMDAFRRLFEEFYSRRHDDEKVKITDRYVSYGIPSTYFLLTLSPQKFSDANPPGIGFLKAHMRSISFGTKIGRPHEAKDHQVCVELSAWYGRSGSMVCAEKDGSSVVIGMGKLHSCSKSRSIYLTQSSTSPRRQQAL